ncbi:MAG: leucyl/phenylalanyl-tRNA--protein transferase [Pseudomonadota bacterium]
MPRDSSDRLDVNDLIAAYAIGYFPMARERDADDVVWVLPEQRGVLPLNEARAPKKLLRQLRKAPFEIRLNTQFRAVMEACAAPAPGREDTWINDQILEAYCELHFMGLAHSVECWRDGALVGGLYGLSIGGVFCGESMFSRADNASKIAFLHLIARLKLGGYTLLDTQFHTDHLAQFGVVEWPDADYRTLLKELILQRTDFYRADSVFDGASATDVAERVSQSITQTS